MKKGLFKYIMLVIDVIAIIYIIVMYLNWNKKNADMIENKNNTVLKEVKYRKFTFQIPSNMNYSIVEDDEKKFKLTTDNYEAIIEIYLDFNNHLITYPDIYYNGLIADGYKVDKPEETTINNTKTIIFKKYDTDNSILCYFSSLNPYGIEIELFNKDNSFKDDYLESVVNIILNAEYDSESSELYTYHNIDFTDELAK